ncbi:MAG: PEP/pyruvate-binding domain-containing protein [Prolixibacteraceae bacterium]
MKFVPSIKNETISSITDLDFRNSNLGLLVDVLNKCTTTENFLQEFCESFPKSFSFPVSIGVDFQYKKYWSREIGHPCLVVKRDFFTPDHKKGSIEIFMECGGDNESQPFLAEVNSTLDFLLQLIVNILSKFQLEKLVEANTEREKELKGINATSEILKKGLPIEVSLQKICKILPDSWQFNNDAVARITYDHWVFHTENFQVTPWMMKQDFQTSRNKKGTIELCYLKEFPEADEGPFLKEERNLLINVANLIAGSATRDIFNKLVHENVERLKELKAINQTSKIIEQGKSVDETLQQICSILPKSWQYPKFTAARIKFEGKQYITANFNESLWQISETFITIDNKKGSIEIFYLKQFPQEYDGPFLSEEKSLLINIAKLISGFLNNYKGREYYSKNKYVPQQAHKSDEFRDSLIKNKKPLQQYFNQQTIDKYIYLDMMKYKVKHILFVATLYDAFVLENEDSFFEKFMGEIYQYSLFSLPRITGVSSSEEALELLETSHFDLVILMVGLDCNAPIILSEKIKSLNESLPIYLLLNKKSDVKYFEELIPTIRSVEKIFVWNGDSLILFSIVKSIEDKVNVENDTKIGLVRVILLIEDSPIYYSKYLQILYSIVFGQVQQLLPEVEKNELDKIGKMRSRPKILLARNYDEAIIIFNKYKDFLLCIISDVEFERSGKLDHKAGYKFIKYVKSHIFDLPVILQSSENSNKRIADKLKIPFINKNSESLYEDIKKYLKCYLGFGNFIFRDKEGNKIGVAKSLRDFETLLQEIPDESFYLHASENQFSLWLMARGEIQLAKTLNPIAIEQFSEIKESRKFFADTFKRFKEEKKKGKILRYDETSTLDEKNIVSFTGGSFGGKGRGLAFINSLINNLDFSTIDTRINIISPITVVIGTDEFHSFITKNDLLPKIIDPAIGYQELRELFAKSSLSHALEVKLKDFIVQIDKPIAVRSSSTSEDSLNQPFAGVFDTYIVPNFSANKRLVFQWISTAIKMVFASVYSDKAKTYFSAIHHKIEEEQMAVILQELIGNQYDNYYYPHISGVAQSYNHYPVAHMEPEEGFAVAAVGLGSYVVDGWKSYRFSPVYPKISMFSVKDLLKSTQVKFYALDTTNHAIDFVTQGELASLKLIDISVAEEDGTLTHCASVYNPDNDCVEPGLDTYGPRVINFADILQYDYIPLAETIRVLLNTIKEAFGSPVEIEYAVDLNRTKNNLPSFYLLQIKPLVGNQLVQSIDVLNLDQSNMILYTESSLGNGQIQSITDIIYVDISKFNKLKTLEMANEIEFLNRQMVKEDRQYVLIGPGRWGTRDPFLGIPVVWSQISNAKVIVEISLDNYPLDSSLGSHFFHNVTSMNIGYFAIQHHRKSDFVLWDELEKQQIINSTNFLKHIRYEKPFTIYMDGIHRKSAILKT